MQIASKVTRPDTSVVLVIKKYWNKYYKRPGYLIFILLFFFISGFTIGAFHSIGDVAVNTLQSLRSPDFQSSILNFISGKLSNPQKLYLDISHKNLQYLLFKQQQAIRQGVILTDDDSYVPAGATSDSDHVQAKVRIKGDYLDHVEDKKISLRIKIRDDKTLYGMSRFSIQSPKRSGWTKEWIFHKFLKYEGLIGLRYDFKEVYLNGDSLGIFAIEESFSKELIESNFRREGPILKFDETAQIDGSLQNKGNVRTQADTYYAADIISFRTAKILENSELKQQFLHARNKLELFRDNKADLEETFDLKKSAKLFAVLDVLCAFHSLRWKNVRFYYNPITDKLELIAYNAYSYTYDYPEISMIFYQIWEQGHLNQKSIFVQDWFDRFFSNREFVETYLSELERITQKGYLESFLDGINDKLNETQNIIYKDGPLIPPPIDGLLKNRDSIRQILHPAKTIKVYLSGDKDDALELLIANTTFLPVELDHVECTNLNRKFLEFSQKEFGAKASGTPLEYSLVKMGDFSSPFHPCLSGNYRRGDNHYAKNLKVRYRIIGLNTLYSAPVDINPIGFTENILPGTDVITKILELNQKRGMLNIDLENRIIHINRGLWKIDYDLIFPPGFKITGTGGTYLSLEEDAAIISYSPIEITGSSEDPFILDSHDRTGQGILVLQAPKKSVLNNVIIRNQTSLSRGAWKLTGAVTIYETGITITNTTFEKNRAEDMLNIVRSEFTVDSSNFSLAASDSLDIDFSKGDINNSTFEKCQNDCIDFSGSDGIIKHIKINGVGDKGVSVGENSRVSIENSTVSDANIAFASKDNSYLAIKNSFVNTSQTAYAAYNKKPEFSGGSMNIENVDTNKIKKLYISDVSSSVILNGKNLPDNIDKYEF